MNWIKILFEQRNYENFKHQKLNSKQIPITQIQNLKLSDATGSEFTLKLA
jgi:hypothetical protein